MIGQRPRNGHNFDVGDAIRAQDKLSRLGPAQAGTGRKPAEPIKVRAHAPGRDQAKRERAEDDEGDHERMKY